MLIYAHRGAHQAHVENTLGAFAAAIEQGADGVELDVRACASGEIVVCHDEDTQRVAGRSLRVANSSWRELRELELDADRLCLLDEAIDLVVGAGRQLNVEVKAEPGERVTLAAEVAALIARRRPAERELTRLSSFDPWIVRTLLRRAHGVPVGLLFDRDHTGLARARFGAAWLDPPAVHPHFSLLSPRRLRRWRRRGRAVHVWTVNDLRVARRLKDLRVDAVITDDVPALRAAGL